MVALVVVCVMVFGNGLSLGSWSGKSSPLTNCGASDVPDPGGDDGRPLGRL